MAQQRETVWLADAPVHPLQQTLKDLERVFNFFAKRADFLRFKKKGRHNSFRYPDPETDQTRPDQQPYLSCLSWLAALPQQPRGIGRSEEHHREPVMRKWFVSIQTEREVQTAHLLNGGAVGIDMGVARFATPRTAHCPRRSTASSGTNGTAQSAADDEPQR